MLLKHCFGISLFALVAIGSIACESQNWIYDVLESIKDERAEKGIPEVRDDPLSNGTCPASYSVVDLGAVDEGQGSNAFAVNSEGAVTGTSPGGAFIDGDAFLWLPEKTPIVGEMHHLTEFGEDSGMELYTVRGEGINDYREIIGQGMEPCHDGSYCATAFYWSEETGVFPLLSGQFSKAEGINNDGVVVGHGKDDQENPGMYLWSIDDGIDFLDSSTKDGAYSNAYPNDINDNDMIVGQIQDEDFSNHAFKWTRANGFSVLADMGNTSLVSSTAAALNNRGQAVGSMKTVSDEDLPSLGDMVPVLWKADGSYLNLGILPSPEGLRYGEATDISNSGLVVGHDSGGQQYSRAWVWCGEDEGKFDLSEMIDENLKDEWQFVSAFGINDSGTIVGIGIHNGQARAYALVPEDS